MTRLLASLVVVIGALLCPAAAVAADPVNAAATLDRAAITVGDRIALTVIVDADPAFAVSDPAIARQVGPFEIVQSQAVVRSTRGTQVRLTYRYVITAWTVGDLVLPAIDVPYVAPDGRADRARTAEVAVHVRSVVAPGEDTSDIKPLKPQLVISEPPIALLQRLALGLGIAAAVGGVIAVGLWLLVRRRAAPDGERLTPVQRALRELDELSAAKLPDTGRTDEHYARLSAILRRYAVERYGVQPGRTSREIRDALERGGLERTQAAAIYEVLREGDEVRFRHSTPYPAHANNAVRAALEIVRRAATAEEYEIGALQPQ